MVFTRAQTAHTRRQLSNNKVANTWCKLSDLECTLYAYKSLVSEQRGVTHTLSYNQGQNTSQRSRPPIFVRSIASQIATHNLIENCYFIPTCKYTITFAIFSPGHKTMARPKLHKHLNW